MSASTVKLNNGNNMPCIGLGTYARNWEEKQVEQAVKWAIDIGYRHIDTAAVYGTEMEVGRGIASKIQDGTVTREQIFVTTKLWNDRHAENDVIPALKESLGNLGLEYVDLYLMHWPVSVDASGEDTRVDYLETWRGMEAAKDAGLARSLGVSNFNAAQLARLLANAKILPVVNQFEISPTLAQNELTKFCFEKSVVPTAYTPLGLLSEARPEFNGLDTIKHDPGLEDIAKRFGKTKAQIVLRYLVQRGIPAIPKSFTKNRIEENINLFDFTLSDQEMGLIGSFDKNHRCVPATQFEHLTNFPF